MPNGLSSLPGHQHQILSNQTRGTGISTEKCSSYIPSSSLTLTVGLQSCKAVGL